jgi:hypothetical protein
MFLLSKNRQLCEEWPIEKKRHGRVVPARSGNADTSPQNLWVCRNRLRDFNPANDSFFRIGLDDGSKDQKGTDGQTGTGAFQKAPLPLFSSEVKIEGDDVLVREKEEIPES